EHAIRKFNGSPKSDFIMVGDRKHDIVGANANGIDSIGVKYGYGSQEELVQANATHLVDTVDELFNLLSP
ncbi:HAD hydrolase-like protein, partial [Ferroacidibacillus organovorans]